MISPDRLASHGHPLKIDILPKFQHTNDQATGELTAGRHFLPVANIVSSFLI
jgi:hypothetical protein